MVRSQGIPARLVVGYAADNIYHAWNEVWTDETGWITPELLLSQKGYNAFALIYRPGAQTACEDLARAIRFIFAHRRLHTKQRELRRAVLLLRPEEI